MAGELVGLRWIDVGLADATVTVTQTLVELPGAGTESEPKTAASGRACTRCSTCWARSSHAFTADV